MEKILSHSEMGPFVFQVIQLSLQDQQKQSVVDIAMKIFARLETCLAAGTKHRLPPSIQKKIRMVIIVLRVDWYDFISFFPAGLSFYDHVIEVVECLNTGWIATNYLVNDLEMALSCLTHIHRVSPHVANWQRSAWPQPQQPPPLATGDDMVHVLKALSELEVKMMSMDIYSPATIHDLPLWPVGTIIVLFPARRHYYCTIPCP